MTQDPSREWVDINRSVLPLLDQREWRHVRWEISAAGVRAIILHRPERLNALNYRMLREIQQLIDHACDTPAIRVVRSRLWSNSSYHSVSAPQ